MFTFENVLRKGQDDVRNLSSTRIEAQSSNDIDFDNISFEPREQTGVDKSEGIDFESS